MNVKKNNIIAQAFDRLRYYIVIKFNRSVKPIM